MDKYPVRIEARDLATGYNGKTVTGGMSFSLHAGEIICIVGPNGAGKSTLLKTLSDQLNPLAGAVFLEGKEMRTIHTSDRAKKMSVLLTGRKDTRWMTCREMASAGRYPYTGRLGTLSDNDNRVVDRALERMGALELQDLPFAGISDGQKQRVLLARALCQEPEVLILDEPASYLDIRYQLELAQALVTLAHEEHLAIIVSLHELFLVRRCADRVLCLKDGHVDRLGTVEEVFEGDYIERLFDLPSGSLDKNEGMGRSVYVDGKKLRTGYTTGTCAALASSGAAQRLLTGAWPESVSLLTPKGVRIKVPLEKMEYNEPAASCGVRKDAGDDIDVTAGALICAEVMLSEDPGIRIHGGKGVGTVKKPGLDQNVGEAAINSVPRKMIRDALSEICEETDYTEGLDVTVFVPDGEAIAGKTLNSELGVEGGISILGTTGIVEPMSRKALLETITLELRQKYMLGYRRVILTPGNMGRTFAEKLLSGHAESGSEDTEGIEEMLGIGDTTGIEGTTEIPVVKCSNFIGEALDACAALNYKQVLLCGHTGKLIKLAGGIMNTHSREADCRREIFCANALMCGVDPEICKEMMECVSTDACAALLKEKSLLSPVMERIVEKAQHYLEHRAPELETGVAMFFRESDKGILSRKAKIIINGWK
ncbi:MAG: cobalt-precorrin-5B (C(1))-methyltransferase [Blautia sp.]|nr:cobalt-precorrin-5B (C(1))-methyltransferase [Blautia sp.]